MRRNGAGRIELSSAYNIPRDAQHSYNSARISLLSVLYPLARTRNVYTFFLKIPRIIFSYSQKQTGYFSFIYSYNKNIDYN